MVSHKTTCQKPHFGELYRLESRENKNDTYLARILMVWRDAISDYSLYYRQFSIEFEVKTQRDMKIGDMLKSLTKAQKKDKKTDFENKSRPR